MRLLALLALVPAPLAAQAMSGMPGMTMPAKSIAKPAKRPVHAGHHAMSAAPMTDAAPSTMSHMNMAMPAVDHAAMAGTATTAGTALPPGDAPAPLPPTDHYADRDYPAAAMARARHAMMSEQGGQLFHRLFFNLAEAQSRGAHAGYRWDGEAWVGGDRDRLAVKSEGEGGGRGVDAAEVQALYSRAVGPYFDLQAGIRHDVAPTARSYATIGVEGLAPYMFETEAALFLSDRGDLLARIEGLYDQRVTQRLVLQPRVELNLAAQDVVRSRIGAGLSDAEFGLRLRYEIAREFAPYVGVSWERKLGATARYARADGEDASPTSLVAGIRFWF